MPPQSQRYVIGSFLFFQFCYSKLMKRILSLILIFGTLGVGIYFVQHQKSENDISFQETEPDTQVEPLAITPEPTKSDIQSLIPQILGPQFNASTAQYTLEDIDQNGNYELIITAIENTADFSSRPTTATIQVVTLGAQAQQYERVGTITYQEWLLGTPEIKETKDVTGDGQPEIMLSLMYGGAASWAEGAVQIDIPKKHIRWLPVRNEQGQTGDAIFLLSTAANHWNNAEFTKTEHGTWRLVETFVQQLPFEDHAQCTIHAYEWNGSLFAYNADLSQQILSQMDADCQP